MIYRNRKALTWIGTSLTLASAIALSACNSKDKESTPAATSSAAAADTAPVAADTAAASEGAAAAASGAPAAEDMHNRMERDWRQKMDHDNMRMGPGMNHPASPAPSPQPTNSGSMPSGGMQDM